MDLLDLVFKRYIKTRKILNTFSNWQTLFTDWYEQTNTIIQFPTILYQIYPDNYQFQEKELSAWRAMLHASGCTNITLSTKKQYIKFWTKVPNPSFDRENIANLYKSGMLSLVEKKSQPDNNNKGEIF